MSVTKREAEAFFADYATALGARDAKAIAEHWGVPAMVLSDERAMAVAKASQTQQFFESSMEQYEGIASAQATIKSMLQLSETVAGCEIEWEHRDEAGKKMGGEAGHYTLKRDADDLKIYVYTPKL